MRRIGSRTRLIPAVILTLGFSATVIAGDGETLYAQKGCSACHGAGGSQPIAPLYPLLAGQNKEYLVRQMRDIKSGERDNGQSPVMQATMASVSDAELVAIAEYLSGL